MPISIAALLLGSLLLVSAHASAQSTAQAGGAVDGSVGIFAGSLKASDPYSSAYGGWLNISFPWWALGTIEIDYFESRHRRRIEACPYDDCSERYEADAEGRPQRVNADKQLSAAVQSDRFRGFSAAVFHRFGKHQRAAPHVVVGFGRLLRTVSSDFDDSSFAQRTYTWNPWGPVAGVGLEIFAGRFTARAQYRFAAMFVGQECIVICNNQLRLGGGWTF